MCVCVCIYICVCIYKYIGLKINRRSVNSAREPRSGNRAQRLSKNKIIAVFIVVVFCLSWNRRIYTLGRTPTDSSSDSAMMISLF